jgi:hypothetical protein
MSSMPPPAKTANFVMAVYQRQRRKSWRRCAKVLGLNSGAQARLIALGQRPAPTALVQQSTHAGIRNPKTLLKKIRRIALPFLEKQQSGSRTYNKKGHRT